MIDDDNLEGLSDNSYQQEVPTVSKKERFPIVTSLVSVGLVIGFVALIGFIFYKSLNSSSFNRDKILLRQVELLNVLKMSSDEQEMQQVVNEYDSLARVLEVIDSR
jgi:hypothetical protein